MSSQRPSFAKRDREMKLKDRARQKDERRAYRAANPSASKGPPIGEPQPSLWETDEKPASAAPPERPAQRPMTVNNRPPINTLGAAGATPNSTAPVATPAGPSGPSRQPAAAPPPAGPSGPSRQPAVAPPPAGPSGPSRNS